MGGEIMLTGGAMHRMSLFLLAAMVFARPVVSYAGWFGPDNFEECMLEKMKGQNSSMEFTAHKACAKLFKLEEEVYFLNDIKKTWGYEAGSITITITENPSNYYLTKGLFSFAPKDCEGAQDSDFGTPREIAFTSGKRTSVSIYPSPICMKTLKLWGTYK
jgi:hypothetical protein